MTRGGKTSRSQVSSVQILTSRSAQRYTQGFAPILIVCTQTAMKLQKIEVTKYNYVTDVTLHISLHVSRFVNSASVFNDPETKITWHDMRCVQQLSMQDCKCPGQHILNVSQLFRHIILLQIIERTKHRYLKSGHNSCGKPGQLDEMLQRFRRALP